MINITNCKVTINKNPLQQLFNNPEDFIDQARHLIVLQESKLSLIADILNHSDGRVKSKQLIAQLKSVLDQV